MTARALNRQAVSLKPFNMFDLSEMEHIDCVDAEDVAFGSPGSQS